MNKFKKVMIMLLSLIMATVVFVGCGGPNENSGKETLVVWLPGGYDVNYKSTLRKTPKDKIALATKALEEGFEEKYPDINLVMQNHGWGTTLNEAIIQIGINSNVQVDVVPGEVLVPTFIDSKLFYDITDVMSDTIKGLAPSGMAVATKDNRVYGVSGSISTLALHVNTKVLVNAGIMNEALTEVTNARVKAANINPLDPATFENLEIVCEEIYNSEWKKGSSLRGAIVLNAVQGYSSAFRALGYMRMAGGDFVNGQGEVTINSVQNEKAFTAMRNLAKYAPMGYTAENVETTLTLSVFTGNVAYNIENCDSLGWSEIGEDIITAPLPQFAGSAVKSNSLVGNCVFSVLDKSQHKEAAVKFLEYISTEEYQIMRAQVNASIPSNLAALESEELKAMDNYKLMQSYYKPFTDESYEVFSGIPSVDSSDYWDAWNSLIYDVLNTNSSISNLMQTCESKMKQAIK